LYPDFEQPWSEHHADWRGMKKQSNPVRPDMTTRPKYLNLLQIRMPLPAVVSIMHRISGAALFFALPIFLWYWQASLDSIEKFEAVKALAALPLVKICILALVWGYLHHLCAGIRHLLSDVDVGTELATARFMSKLVLAVSIVLTVAIGACLW
jgi:succinate dehydrogenase / fumarate reductase cytochrome b subunit